ncbi:MAG: T9SS type A sorting domain-containing protein [Bacteroidota bacterium]
MLSYRSLIVFPFLLTCLPLIAQTQVGSNIIGEASSDGFGSRVAISADGTRIIASALNNDGTANLAGHARVFEFSGGTWSQVGADLDGEAENDRFGHHVTISADGTRAAASSPRNTSLAGHVRVYDESGGVWSQVGADIDAEAAGDQSGQSISLSGDGFRIAIGAPQNDGNGGASGHVRILEESGGVWSQVGADIDGEAAGDNCGHAVALSNDGTRLIVGAISNYGTASNAGHARVFEESGGTWTQVGADLDGEAGDDRFGLAVAISSDGKRVAVGGPFNDGTDTDAGHVRVFEESGGVWSQVGADIDGVAGDDRSGFYIDLSSDGAGVAIGAANNDGSFSNAGHVRIFQESGGTWTQVGSDITGSASGNNLAPVGISANGSTVIVGESGFGSNGRAAIFSTGLTLPVELISFQAFAQPKGVELRWRTATELNNEGFEVQRSAANTEWITLGWVAGQGTINNHHSYQYKDAAPLAGTNYYRLKQVDFDGAWEYSEVISVEPLGLAPAFEIFPNPVQNNLQMRLYSPLNTTAMVQLTDLTGRVVQTDVLEASQLQWSAESLSAGWYTLTLLVEGHAYQKKFVVQ